MSQLLVKAGVCIGLSLGRCKTLNKCSHTALAFPKLQLKCVWKQPCGVLIISCFNKQFKKRWIESWIGHPTLGVIVNCNICSVWQTCLSLALRDVEVFLQMHFHKLISWSRSVKIGLWWEPLNSIDLKSALPRHNTVDVGEPSNEHD